MKILNFLKKFKLVFLIVLLFVLVRVPDLGHDNFNTDTWKWKARIYDFGQGVFTLDFEKTIQKYHPGVTLLWVGTAAVKVYNLYYDVVYKMPPNDNSVFTVFELDFVQKLMLVITMAIAYGFGYTALKRIKGELFAFITSILIVLDPFYLGLTRVLHLEGLMTTFLLVSVLYLYLHTIENKKLDFVWSTVFATLAVLTKTSSLSILPFAFLVFYIGIWQKKTTFKAATFNFLKWLALFILFFFMFWPAMWTHAGLALTTLYRGIVSIGVEGGHEQIYFGKFLPDPGPTFYFVVMAFKSSIPFILGLLLLPFTYKKLDDKSKGLIKHIAIFSGLYFLEITIASKKLDRYVLPTMIGLLVIVSCVFTDTVARLNIKLKHLSVGFITLLVVYFAVVNMQVHPDYFTYNNPLFGGLGTSVKVLEPKWLIGEREIVAYVRKLQSDVNYTPLKDTESVDRYLYTDQVENMLLIGFSEKYYTQVWPFVYETGARATIQDLTPQAVKSKFFIYPVWEDAGVSENRFKLEKVDEINVRGVHVYNVYRRL